MVDIDVLIARLGRSQHAIVTRDQLASAGATRFQVNGAVRRGMLVPIHTGVFVVGGREPAFEGLVLAAAWAAKGYASHRAGAALFGLRRVPGGYVDITVEDRVPRLDGVNAHTVRGLTRIDRTVIGIIPVLHPAVILLQLAGAFPGHVEGALDDALVRRVTSLSAVERVLTRLGGKGRAGSVVLRDLVGDRRAGQRPTESALEDDFVALAKDYRVDLPARQHPLELGSTGPDARCDFGDPDRQLDLEIDGDRYHAGKADQKRDADRDRRVRDEGWAVRRFTTADIRDRPDAVAAVVRALQLRRSRPASP